MRRLSLIRGGDSALEALHEPPRQRESSGTGAKVTLMRDPTTIRVRSWLEHNLGRFGNARRMCIVDHNEVQASHVVAFSLYGSNPRYVKGGLAKIHAYREWFPEFTCRFMSRQISIVV